MKYALECKNVCKSYGDFSLKNVSFALPQGCIMGFIGENGAGKSTTIKAILNLISIDSGHIALLGEDASRRSKNVSERIGVVLDECNFPEMARPSQIGKILSSLFSTWEESAYQDYLRRFHISKDRPVRELSRGMKAKLSIAAALSHGAELLVLDEASSGLDPVVRGELLSLLLDFLQDERHSVLMSSHITSDLEKVADYITLIQDGRILFCREKNELLESYCVLKCAPEALPALNPQDVIGWRKGSFGAEALVRRQSLRAGQVYDAASIEDIMYFFRKGKPSC